MIKSIIYFFVFVAGEIMTTLKGKPYGEKCGDCGGEGGKLVWVTDGSKYVKRRKWFTCHKCGGNGFVEPRRKMDCGG